MDRVHVKKYRIPGAAGNLQGVVPGPVSIIEPEVTNGIDVFEHTKLVRSGDYVQRSLLRVGVHRVAQGGYRPVVLMLKIGRILMQSNPSK